MQEQQRERFLQEKKVQIDVKLEARVVWWRVDKRIRLT